MENLPFVVRVTLAENSKAAGSGKTKRKTVECLVGVGELLVPALETNGVAVCSLMKPYAKTRGTLCRNLQLILGRGVRDMRILPKLFFDA